mmetsp:Transcript_11528/g.11547  ORF Transcript_11528/g.11547 Transcript_11528/m.11547 type:complete len:215 (+) Transcript_11528:125-769(+)
MVKYYTAEEVSTHNCAEDCWVSIYNDVYDITSLVSANRGPLAEPLIKEAGKSISHWFSEDGNIKTFIDPEKNIRLPYTPQGRFLHVPPSDPTEFGTSYDLPWWKDSKYIAGKLTTKARMLKIVNMLTHTEDVISTCQEEAINDILERYVQYNRHARSYTWKALIGGEFVNMNMDMTLEENGVPDETETFYELGMDDDFYIPTLHIYFNDDLTVE